MDLETKKNEMRKKYEYTFIHKIYFNIEKNSEKFVKSRILFIILLTICFFTLSYFFELPTIKDESLYIFAAQVTLIALIFPIILTLIGILYNKNNNFDSIFQIYKQNTSVKTLYGTAFIIILFYIISFLFSYDVSLSEKIRVSLNNVLAIMFIDTLLITYFFLERTISFTTNNNLNEILIRHYINSNESDESIKILSIISDRINEDIDKNDISSYENNIDTLIHFIHLIFLNSTQFKNNSYHSDLNKILPKEWFSTKNSKLFSLIHKNFEHAIKAKNRQFYDKIKSIYFYIFYKNKDILEIETALSLLEFHRNYLYFLDSEVLNNNPKFINGFISSWYKWITMDDEINNTIFSPIYFKHIELTISMVNQFQSIQYYKGLDLISDCLCTWESHLKSIPSYIENKIITYYDEKKPQTFSNYILDSKLIAFHVIDKSIKDTSLIKKYYNLLIKGESLNKDKPQPNSVNYFFSSLDSIIFSYLRLLSNSNYEEHFNRLLEKLETKHEIIGLSYLKWLPTLENRLSTSIIKILLINLSYAPSKAKWLNILEPLNIFQLDTNIRYIKNLINEVEQFNDFTSLSWNQKKLDISKQKLIKHFNDIIVFINETIEEKTNNITLDKEKIAQLEYENTLRFENLDKVTTNSLFFNIFPSYEFRKNIQKNLFKTKLDSKILSKDYHTHISMTSIENECSNIIDNLIFNTILKNKESKIIKVIDHFDTVTKLLLCSYKFEESIIIYNDSNLINYFLHNYNNKTELPYYIECKDYRHFRFGNTTFIHDVRFNENIFYITPLNIIKNIFMEKDTRGNLTSTKTFLHPEDNKTVILEMYLPLEIELNEDTYIIEVIIS